MAINFPSNPTNGQTFYDSTSGNRYYFDSTESRWVYAANNQPFPIASDKQVLFNNAGGLDGTPGLTFDTSSNTTFVNDLNVANNITGVNSVFFDTSATGAKGTVATGELTWNPDDYTLDLGVNTAIMQIGQEIYYRVKNQTGSMIPNGTVVMAAGTVGASGRILVAPAIADGSYPSKYVMGITTQDIPNGGDGFVTSFGKIRGLDTSMWSEGDILYANPAVAGGLSNTMPLAPNTKTTVAIVVNKHANNGELFIRPTYGSKLNEDELIELAGLANGDILAYVTANGRFENKPYDTYLPNTSNAVFVGDLRVKGNVYVGSNTVTISNNVIHADMLNVSTVMVNGSAIPTGDQSNAMYDLANAAFGHTNTTLIHSQAVYDSVNSAFGIINSAFTQSNTDNVRLSSAYTSSNAAYTLANAAFEAANAEYTFSNNIYAAVNSAFGVINSAYTQSNTDNIRLSGAYVSLNAGYTVANAGFTVANAAFGHSNTTYNAVNSSFGVINAAFTQSNTDNVRLSAAYVVVNAAFAAANTIAAYTPANAAFAAANQAGVVANNANTYGNSTYVKKAGDTITGDLVVQGNLTTSGVVTYANTQTLLIGDSLITLNADIPAAAAPSQDAGIEVDRGSSANVSLLWNEGSDVWTFTNDGTNYKRIASNTDIESGNTYAQTVYAAVNSSFAVINAAFTQSNTDNVRLSAAYTSSNAGFTVANAAFGHSNNTYAAVNSAFAVINANYTSTNANYVVSNAAFAKANATASDLANTATSANNYAGAMANSGNVFSGLVYTAVNSAFGVINAAYTSSNASYVLTNSVFTQSNTDNVRLSAAYVVVNAAYTSSNAGYTVANAAFAKANAAASDLANTAIAANNYSGAMANSGNVFSGLVYTAVNSAFGVINAAYTSANANYVVTNAAFTQSNNEVTRLSAAYVVSNAAFAKANTTASDLANTAIAANNYAGAMANSGNAYTVTVGTAANNYAGAMANSGNVFTGLVYTAVNSAFGVINAAYTSSNADYTLTNAAFTVANAAFGRSNTEITRLSAAYVVANAAFGTANAKVASVSGTSGRITSSGGTAPTIDLATAGAGAATYSSGVSSITVDAYGRVTSVTGSAGYVTSSGVTSVAAGTGLSGGTITSTGTISMPNVGPGAGSYSSGISALTLDAQGRVTAITGSAGYITASGSITGSAYSGFVQDTRNTVTGPSTGSRTVRWDFVANATDGLSDGGLYHGVMTFQQWVDASGGGTRQLGFTDNDNLWIRGSGTGVTSYNSWKLLLNSSNYNSYAPTLTGTGASGTWGISISGSAAQAGGFTPSQTSGAANRIVVASANGYILNNYFFSTDDVSGGTLTYLMGKFGDNYYRSATAAKVAAFISGQSMNINGSATSAASATTASQLNGVSHTEIPNGNNGSGVQWATVSNMSTNHKTGWYSYNNPTNAPTATYHTWMNVSGHVNNDQYGWQLSGPYWGDALYYRKKEAGAGTENWKTWRQVVLAGVSVADIIQSDASVRGPIFYDSNDTARYVDPNGTSVLNDVRGDIFYQRDDTNNRWDVGYLVLRSASPTIYFRDTDHNSAMLHNNSNLLYVLRGGNDTEGWAQVNGQWPVVINLTNNDMTIGGSFAAIGNVTAYASDRRLKENIKEIPNAIEKIRAIRGVTFDWNEISEQNGFTPSRKYGDIGCIAQEVEAVLPQVVTLAPFDVWIQDPDCEYTEEEIAAKTGTSKSGKNYLTVQYERIVPLLIQAIKEQQEQIDELKRRFENN